MVPRRRSTVMILIEVWLCGQPLYQTLLYQWWGYSIIIGNYAISTIVPCVSTISTTDLGHGIAHRVKCVHLFFWVRYVEFLEQLPHRITEIPSRITHGNRGIFDDDVPHCLPIEVKIQKTWLFRDSKVDMGRGGVRVAVRVQVRVSVRVY